VRRAQIERLRSLKKKIIGSWQSQIGGPKDAGTVLIDVEELVDILLMEVEDHE